MQLSEEQQMLAQLAERLFTDKAPISALRELRDSDSEKGYDQSLWQAMVEAGLTGILVPEAHGGMAFGLVGAGLVAREIGRTLAVTPFLSTAILAASGLAVGGTEAQRERWLPAIVEGRALATLAVDESTKHRPEAIATEATGSGDRITITGEKRLVLDGQVADLLLVAARNGGQRQLFAVETGASGVTIEHARLVDSRNAAYIRFDNVAAEPLADGAAALEIALRNGRAILAAELAGLSREVFNRTLGYLHERKQFGLRIGAFQALQHRAAHLSVEIAMSEALAMKALASCDANAEDAATQVLAAKAKAAQVARLATAEAVQMHGGMGMTDEFDIGFFMKRARAASETLGDANYCNDRFAAASGY